MIRKGKEEKEQRILVKKNGRKTFQRDVSLGTERFYHKHIIFGSIGLLGGYWQPQYDYHLVREETAFGEKALVIEAIPRSGENLERLYGKIWIKEDDGSILKIEWNQKSLKNIEGIKKIADWLNAEPLVTFISEYGFEKNGIRFPSRYYIKEEYIHPERGRFMKSITTVTYEDYKFFTVEIEVKY